MGESRVKTKNPNWGYGLNSNELDCTDGDIMGSCGTLEKSHTTTPRRSSSGASFGSVIKSRQWTAPKAVFCPLAVGWPLSARLRAFGFHDLLSILYPAALVLVLLLPKSQNGNLFLLEFVPRVQT